MESNPNNSTGNLLVITDPFRVGSSLAALPIMVTTAAKILAANPLRFECIITNTGTTVIYLALGQSQPSTTAYHIALAGCSTANDGTGGTFISYGWQGAVLAC